MGRTTRKSSIRSSTEGHGRARSIWAKIMNEVTEAKPELFPTKEFAKPDGHRVDDRIRASAASFLPN